MNMKFSKKVTKIVSLGLAAIFLAMTPCTESAAAEAAIFAEAEPEVLEAVVTQATVDENMPNFMTTFAQCFFSVSGSDEGMSILIHTGTTGIASVVGVKDIKIQKKVWYGWSTVAVSDGGEQTDVSGMAVTILYRNAVKGETYRILCTHYADVDGYEEFEADSGEFVYTY